MKAVIVMIVLVVALSRSAHAQLVVVPSACGDGLAYDRSADRVVWADWVNGLTLLFDGSTWSTMSATTPQVPFRWATFDTSRQVTVCVSFNPVASQTWEWNGAQWANVGPSPSPFSAAMSNTYFWGLIAYHPALQSVVVLATDAGGGYAELKMWNGAGWTPLPSSAMVVRPDPFRQYTYHTIAYDAVTGKLVLFGRTELLNSGSLVAILPLTWEWDAQAGWVQQPTNGVVGDSTMMWFDEHRGRLLRYDISNGPVNSVSMRSLSGVWSPVPFSLGLGMPMHFMPTYDSLRSRWYMRWASGNGYLTYQHPALYSSHGSGCAGPGAPELALMQPWTRPWLGDSLGVTVSPAPQSVAVLATGFTDQSWGAATLPLPLAAYGMPGCTLNAAPEHLLLAAGSAGLVTFQLPVPSITALVGLAFWQQAFAWAPGANPAGVLVSNSMRGQIGRLN